MENEYRWWEIRLDVSSLTKVMCKDNLLLPSQNLITKACSHQHKCLASNFDFWTQFVREYVTKSDWFNQKANSTSDSRWRLLKKTVTLTTCKCGYWSEQMQ